MLTKVIDQSKIDHFAKWLERADKIVIVAPTVVVQQADAFPCIENGFVTD